jgi:hypothetical protein
MILNVLYDIETGAVKRWSNRAFVPNQGEDVIQIKQRNLLGASWRVDPATKSLVQVVPPQTWTSIRIVRDALLAQTDYTTQADYPMSGEQRAAVLAYRQNLRDITETFKTPAEVVWPVNPLA